MQQTEIGWSDSKAINCCSSPVFGCLTEMLLKFSGPAANTVRTVFQTDRHFFHVIKN